MSTSNASRDLPMHDFRSARGEEADEDWAATAWASLVLRGGVSSEAADEELQRVLALVRESGEGPEELYGPPQEWARDRTAEWASEGSSAFRDDAMSLRDVPQLSAFSAVIITLLMGLVDLVQGKWTITWTLAWVLLPILGPVVGFAAAITWDRLATHRSMPISASVTMGVLLGGSAGLATLFGLSNAHPLGRASIIWCLGLAAAYATLAWVWGRLLPERPVETRVLDDDAWTGELARMLRSRPDCTEERVQHMIDEARSHAAASGQSLQTEFGNPAAYAAQVSPRPIVTARRSVAYRVATLALWLWLCGDLLGGHESWPSRIFFATCFAFLALNAGMTVVRYLRLSRRQGRRR